MQFLSLFGVGKDSGKITGRIVDSDMHDVGRFLNRILGLVPDIQNRSVTYEFKSISLLQLGVVITVLNIYNPQAVRVICQHLGSSCSECSD